MKSRINAIMLVILMACGSRIYGQYTRTDIFTVPELTWFGLDFSMVRLIGPDGFTDPKAIKEIYFMDMNNLVRLEPDKYDLKKAFHKEKVGIDLNVVKERNLLPEMDQIIVPAGTVYYLEDRNISDIIKEYTPEATEGIGVVFIMESLNKPEEKGYMWVTFFDMASKEVLFAQKMVGVAGGFGWRNYWARTFYNVLKEIGKTRFEAWSQQE